MTSILLYEGDSPALSSSMPVLYDIFFIIACRLILSTSLFLTKSWIKKTFDEIIVFLRRDFILHFVRIGFTICLYFFLLICSQPSTAAAAEKPILYIPLDDRPVCLSYVVETMEAAGFSVITPPADLLASRGRDGDPAKLWKWLYQNAGNADAAILATDSLVYGGLDP